MNPKAVIANATLVNLLPTAAKTATGAGSAIDLTPYEGNVAIFLDSAAGTGTTPLLDLKITESVTSGGTYTDITGATFTQVAGTASRQKIVIDADKCKGFVKANYTIAGGTPSFTFSVNALALKKYVE